MKKSLAARGENCVIAIVEGQLDFDGAVVLQFGCSVTEISSPLSNPLQWEEDDAATIFEFGSGR